VDLYGSKKKGGQEKDRWQEEDCQEKDRWQEEDCKAFNSTQGNAQEGQISGLINPTLSKRAPTGGPLHFVLCFGRGVVGSRLHGTTCRITSHTRVHCKSRRLGESPLTDPAASFASAPNESGPRRV
jgi:hypothetical protein